ncbi:MAG: HAMP domain-containing histidine kinase [Oscillospiraceae bacterium]|nr:HAMP domain-containing histidine kinase [Oscillospiraceae bacterium]
MKLWQKISLICSLVLLMVMAICILGLSYHARSKILGVSISQAKGEFEQLESSFRYECYSHVSKEDSPSVQNSLLKYCFSKFASDNAQLYVDTQLVYGDELPSLNSYLPFEKVPHSRDELGLYTDKERIVLGCTVTFPEYGDTACRIYLTQDISSLNDEIVSMQLQFGFFGLVCSFLGLAVIYILVRRSMAGLNVLEKAAETIAYGDYSSRAIIGTDDELATVAQSFNKMAEAVEHHVAELEDSAYRQKMFSAAVSHEFKTPLTSILLNADNLKNTYMSEDEQFEALESIEQETRWLEMLTAKLLKLITVNSELEKKTLSIDELLSKVEKSVENKLDKSGCTLVKHNAAESIHGDMDLLQSALVNLVDNAIKASQPGQDIILGAEDGMLYVKDFGRGISGEALNRVTEPFFMEDKSRSKKSGGVGLGLALVHEIAEAHNAKLEIDSEVGKGCTAKIIFAGNKTVISR